MNLIQLAENNIYLRKDGFLFLNIFQYSGAPRDALYVNEDFSDKQLEYIIDHRIDKIIIDNAPFTSSTLDRVKNLNFIKYLIIYGDKYNVESLYTLNELVLLSIDVSQSIDISRFPKLEWLSTRTPSNIVNLDKLTSLKSLIISSRYNPIEESTLESISKLINLDTLKISHTGIKNLDFLTNQMKINVLYLWDNPKLISIDGIQSLASTLTKLRIVYQRKINSFEYLNQLKKLKFLYLEADGPLPNISFINGMTKLHSCVIGSTLIRDGNLTPLMKLKHCVVLPFRSHYHYIHEDRLIKLKFEDFPYNSDRNTGDSDIELWRRLDN